MGNGWVEVMVMKVKVVNPCNGCKERTSGCHAICPRGIAYEKWWNGERKRQRELKQKDIEFNLYTGDHNKSQGK